MKALLIIVAVCVTACSSIKTHQSACSKGKADVIRAFVLAATMDGFEVTTQDGSAGYASATKQLDTYGTGADRVTMRAVWSVNATQPDATSPTTVVASCKQVSEAGMDFYPDDSYADNSGTSWYWSIRRALESTCGTTLVAIRKQ